MGWYDIFEKIILFVFISNIIINFSYFKRSLKDNEPYEFKTIWHKRWNTLTLCLLVINFLYDILTWVFKYI